MLSLGTSLRKAIEARDLSPAELARRVSISPQRLRHYLKDDREPPLDLLMKLARALDLEVGDLLLGRVGSKGTPGFSEEASTYKLDAPNATGWSAPEWKTDPSGPFYVQVDFAVHDLLPAGSWCLVDPGVEIARDRLAYCRDRLDRVAIGTFAGTSSAGWLKLVLYGREMISEHKMSSIARLHPITWTGWGHPPLPPGHSGLIERLDQAIVERDNARRALARFHTLSEALKES